MLLQKNNDSGNVQRIAVCGVMLAVAVLVDGVFKVPVNLFGSYALKLSFGLVPILYLSIRFGSLYGGISAVLMDFLQAVLFPIGGYNPLFTISAFVMGIIPGMFFRKNQTITRLHLLFAVFCGQFLGSVFLSTFFLVISYGLPWVIGIPRAITQALQVPLFTMLILLILELERVAHRNLV